MRSVWRAAPTVFLFELKAMESRFDMADPQGKTDFYREAAGKLLRFEDELERKNYIQAVADTYGISPEDLRKMVNRLALRGAGISEPVKPPVRRPQKSGEGKRIRAVPEADAHLADFLSADL